MVVGLAARKRMTVADADYDYTINGIEHPVSGDLTSRTYAHLALREYHRYLVRPSGTVVAAGRLRRPADPNRVQCTDCPWGLTVQGWDAGAYALAHRHAAARGHRVTTWVR